MLFKKDYSWDTKINIILFKQEEAKLAQKRKDIVAFNKNLNDLKVRHGSLQHAVEVSE